MLPVSPWNSEGYMRSTRVLVVMLLVCVSVVVEYYIYLYILLLFRLSVPHSKVS